MKSIVPPRIPKVTVYSRHVPGCRFTSPGTRPACKCPKWLSIREHLFQWGSDGKLEHIKSGGTTPGLRSRISAKTNSWIEAELLAQTVRDKFNKLARRRALAKLTEDKDKEQSTMVFNPRWIVGKTVASVEMNPFEDGAGGTAHAPRIWFTDGAHITFTTEETEVGGYGTAISYWKPSA